MVNRSRSRRIVRSSALSVIALALMSAVAGCPLAPPSPFICQSHTPTPVSPTEEVITITCTVGATEPPATYTAEFFATDLLGLRAVLPLSVKVT